METKSEMMQTQPVSPEVRRRGGRKDSSQLLLALILDFRAPEVE